MSRGPEAHAGDGIRSQGRNQSRGEDRCGRHQDAVAEPDQQSPLVQCLGEIRQRQGNGSPNWLCSQPSRVLNAVTTI